MSAALTNEQFDRELSFRTSLSVMITLLNAGLLTEQEYRRTEAILTQKFPPVWAGLDNVLKETRKASLSPD